MKSMWKQFDPCANPCLHDIIHVLPQGANWYNINYNAILLTIPGTIVGLIPSCSDALGTIHAFQRWSTTLGISIASCTPALRTIHTALEYAIASCHPALETIHTALGRPVTSSPRALGTVHVALRCPIAGCKQIRTYL